MPGVVVLPHSPGLGGFGSSHSSTQSFANRFHEMSVADIKTKAREAVQKEAKGASPLSLIRIARTQLLSAKEHELKGDLRSALGSYIKAASLAKMTMDSAEFVQERSGKGGVLRKELNDFLEHDGRDLTARTSAVEEKLKSIQSSQQTQNEVESSDGLISNSGGSIADRLRALQDNGLAVGTSKRFIRETPNAPPVTTGRLTNGNQSSPTKTFSTLAPSAPASSAPSPHTLVPPSSLGPPSPSSSPSSSPQMNNFDISGFTQTFPSIDELDENPAFSLPSVPTGPIPPAPTKPLNKDIRNGEPSISSISPLTSFRNYTIPLERPSSTPVTPVNTTFPSRPPSPSKQTNSYQPSKIPSPVPSTSKPPLPVKNTAFPKELHSYIRDYNVLVIDVRNRADFEREHIKAHAVVCIEPSVLMRGNVTADMLEDSMVIAPKNEISLFGNRDKFDLVAVYDESSPSFGACETPLSVLVRVINEQAFRKMLKRMPMMLVGGLEAWKRDMGSAELVRGDASLSIDNQSLARGSEKASSVISSPPSSRMTPFTPNGLITSASPPNSTYDPRQVWTPPTRPESTSHDMQTNRLPYSPDIMSGHMRSPADVTYTGNHPSVNVLSRKPAIIRPGSGSISFTRSTENTLINGASSPITYPQFPRHISPTASGSGSHFVSTANGYDITSPPQASINPPQSSRRRSDFVDQSQEALSGLNSRPSIDYPELASQQILRPPPAAASSALERQDNRPRVPQIPPGGPTAPRIPSDYPVTYWLDTQIGISGLKNLGNTCYMNAPIQCLSATVPFARFFTDGRWKSAVNYTNPLGSKGRLTGAFAKLLQEMWGGDLPYLTPIDFRKSICMLKSQYNGTDQHDSQEFLSFLIDGIHEDLNRVMVKPSWTRTPEEEAELERLPPQIASEQEWRTWRSRNDSLIVDFFQGQFRNRLECLTCHKTSTTYNVFSILQLPIPHGKSGKVPIERCLDAFFNEEILESDDAWDCPQCKVKRRASKKLSLARLPPILLIHFKRFEANGRFSDKVDTFVEFPMTSLDLTTYMPPPLPPGADKGQLNGGFPLQLDDPRTQIPPYRYDLYGVTNHYGNLSSGHYTAFIASHGGWMYCDDSSVKPADPKQVVNQKAYVLFYKRVRT